MKKQILFAFLMVYTIISYSQTISSITKQPQSVSIINEEAGGVQYDASSTVAILQRMLVYKRSSAPTGNNYRIIAYQQNVGVPSVTLNNTPATCNTRHWSTSISVSRMDTYEPTVTIPFTVGTVTYSVSNPTLVEIVSANTYRPSVYSTTDPRKAIFIKEGVSVAQYQNLGTLTMTITVDGVVYPSQTVNLTAAIGYGLCSITSSETGSTRNFDIINKQYSVDGGTTWTSLPASLNLATGSSFKMRATFVNQSSSTTVTYAKIIGTGVDSGNTFVGTGNSSTTITSPTTTLSGNVAIQFNINTGM